MANRTAHSIEIFISHISDDRRYAEALQAFLHTSTLGIARVFHTSDPGILRPGTDWWPELRDRLDASSLLLAVMTPRSIASPWIHFEAGAVWKKDVPVIPCCTPSVPIADLRPPLSFMQAVDLGDPEGWRRLLSVVASTADIDVPTLERGAELVGQLEAIEAEVSLDSAVLAYDEVHALLAERVSNEVLHVRNVSGRDMHSFFLVWNGTSHPAAREAVVRDGETVSLLVPKAQGQRQILQAQWLDADSGQTRQITLAVAQGED